MNRLGQERRFGGEPGRRGRAACRHRVAERLGDGRGRRIRWRRFRPLAVAVALAPLAGCVGAGSESPPSRESFVDVYVALRTAELRSPGAVIADGDRDRILAEHEVTEDDLLAFAEAHGRDAVFMEELWTEVQSRMVELASQPDREDP